MGIKEMIETKRKKRKTRFKEVANKWLEEQEEDAKEEVFLKYKLQVQKYLMPEFERMTLDVLEKYDCRDFFEELGEDLTEEAVREILEVFKAILFFAEIEYDYNFNKKRIKMTEIEKTLPKWNEKILV